MRVNDGGWQSYRARRRSSRQDALDDGRPRSARAGIISGLAIIGGAAVLALILFGLAAWLEGRDPGDQGFEFLVAIAIFFVCLPVAGYGAVRAIYGVMLLIFPWLRPN